MGSLVVLKDTQARLSTWWTELTGRQQLGYVLAGLGVALTLVLALVRGFASLSSGWSLSVAVVGVLFQGGAAFAFGRVGKADPAHAQASVRALYRLASRSTEARALASDAFEQPGGKLSGPELKTRMGLLSTRLSFIEEDALDAIDDWRLFHPQAVELVEGRKESDDDSKQR